MNKNSNLNLVTFFGDESQLYIGSECGSYAKYIEREKLKEFCEHLNDDPIFKINGYFLTSKYNYGNEKSCVTLKHFTSNLQVPVRLLDHTIYFVTSDDNWEKIDESLFDCILKAWRKFLANNISEYKSHFNKTITMCRQDSINTL